MFIAVNVIRAMIPTPTARPSMPSVRFAPFAAPAMIRNRSTKKPNESPILQSSTGT